MSKRKRLLGVFVLALLAAVAAVFGTGFAARAASSGETELTPSLSVGQISVSGNALIVDFGIKTASNAGMLDREAVGMRIRLLHMQKSNISFSISMPII